MTWEEVFDSYQSARRDGDRTVTAQIVKNARRLLSKASAEDWRLLEEALHDPERKWLLVVAEVKRLWAGHPRTRYVVTVSAGVPANR